MFDLFSQIGGGDFSQSRGGASAGKGFMPFLKQCSTYFCQIGGGVFSYRLGHFLREGMKPSPALGMRHPDLNILASA